jgi:hypothetical protein
MKVTTELGRILSRAIDDIEALFETSPEIFKLNSLSIDDKVRLLRMEPKFFKSKLDLEKLSEDDKLYVLYNLKDKKITKEIILNAEELNAINDNSYCRLLEIDFDRFITVERFETLSREPKADIFMKHPAWVVDNALILPKLTKDRLSLLSYTDPKFVDSYITNFSEYSTDQYFWKNMIRFNAKYKGLFLRNTKSLVTKTEVRRVVREKPHIIQLIGKDTLTDSKLTIKEWILLIDSVLTSYPKMFKDWVLPADVAEVFRLDLTVEMLTGKSKVSVRFQNAMKGVFGVPVEEVSEEESA